MKPQLHRRPGFAPVLLACALALASATAFAAESTNGAALWPALGAGPNGAVGSIVASPTGCLIEFTVSIVTESGGGSDAFEIQVADDGQIVQTIPLQAPADGQAHEVTGAFRLAQPPGNETPGIGLYLVDDGNVLDILDPLVVGCSPLEVPALGGRGFVALGGLLAATALLALRRHRRS